MFLIIDWRRRQADEKKNRKTFIYRDITLKNEERIDEKKREDIHANKQNFSGGRADITINNFKIQVYGCFAKSLKGFFFSTLRNHYSCSDFNKKKKLLKFRGLSVKRK